MELRFLEGNFEHGRFKLQYRQEWDGKNPPTYWLDVPCVKEEQEIHLDSGIELIKRIKACFGFDLAEAKRWYDHMRFWSERKSREQHGE